MFLKDLPKWIKHGKELLAMKKNPKNVQKLAEAFGVEIKVDRNYNEIKKGILWLDTGKHKTITKVEIES